MSIKLLYDWPETPSVVARANMNFVMGWGPTRLASMMRAVSGPLAL
jgi:hypothetical protein